MIDHISYLGPDNGDGLDGQGEQGDGAVEGDLDPEHYYPEPDPSGWPEVNTIGPLAGVAFGVALSRTAQSGSPRARRQVQTLLMLMVLVPVTMFAVICLVAFVAG